MSNAEKCFFKDFTRENYKLILNIARTQYSFKFFTDNLSEKNWVLWRHDVDYSPNSALRLAMIESDLGIKATYFLLIHSEFYNLFEKEVTNHFKCIKEMGHQLGLHFDNSYYKATNAIDLK